MKAISLIPGTSEVNLREMDEPMITTGDGIKIKMLQVGICGTDREQVEGGRADAPAGKNELIIGHEMFGRVTAVGQEVYDVVPGDFGVFTVRRGCAECPACLNNRSDMCYTGRYTERGIKGADGFQAEYVVDSRAYFIKVPPEIRTIGVLTEPMSVAAKAIDEAMILQQGRLENFDRKENWLKGKRALVAGIGPIGLMAAVALKLRGADVIGMDIVDETSLRVNILKEIGGRYVDGRVLDVMNIDDVCGGSDFVFEATGIAKLQIQLIDTLAVNGIYVATGIPAGKRPMTIMAGDIMQQLVLKNQILVGSVNASFEHYKMAVEDLVQSHERWPQAIENVITSKVPYTDFKSALKAHASGEIKTVIKWDEAA